MKQLLPLHRRSVRTIPELCRCDASATLASRFWSSCGGYARVGGLTCFAGKRSVNLKDDQQG